MNLCLDSGSIRIAGYASVFGETYELGGNSFVTKPTTAAGLRDGLRKLGEYWTGVSRLP